MAVISFPSIIGVDSAKEIGFVQEAFGLSDGEFGYLFFVSRQAIQQWRSRGIPPGRVADVDRIVELAQFLQRRLIARRVPQIVRTAAKSLDGKTMLEVLRESGVVSIYQYVERLAAYSNA